ncbi:MAG: DUF4252 domain-containing protein, partial [Bacteroidota bacterium]
MKNKLIVLLGLLMATTISLTGQSNANAIDSYFQEYVEDESFSVVYISPRLFRMFESFSTNELELDDAETEAFVDVASDIRGLRILSTDVTPSRYFEEAKRRIDTRLYETLMTIRDRDGGNTELLLKENAAGELEELLFLSYGEE